MSKKCITINVNNTRSEELNCLGTTRIALYGPLSCFLQVNLLPLESDIVVFAKEATTKSIAKLFISY